MARKEILICDNCKQEHNELTRPVRDRYIDTVYGFELCEECYKKISEIDKRFEKRMDKAREQFKTELKKETEEIYKMLFPREYGKEVEKDV